jgi:hypothetical protein
MIPLLAGFLFAIVAPECGQQKDQDRSNRKMWDRKI